MAVFWIASSVTQPLFGALAEDFGARAVFFALPQWEPHGRRRMRALFDFSLVRGPVGLLALGRSFASVAFVTFTSSLPTWLVHEHDYESDDPLIGWTLGTFALAAGIGAPPRFRSSQYSRSTRGPQPFFVAAGIAGALIYTSSPVKVVVAQDLAPAAPAAAAGMILGTTAAIAGRCTSCSDAFRR